MKWLHGAFLGLAFLLVGCEQQDPNLAKETTENPHFAAAEQNLNVKNYVEAVKSYEAALQANPDVALAHYEIARIYSDWLNDPVSAIYHYNKYLELRPQSDRRETVEKLREDAKLTFVASHSKSAEELKQSVERLQNENRLAKSQLEVLSKELSDAKAKLTQAAGQVAGTGTQAVETATETVETTVTEVAAGETPSVLANVVNPAASSSDAGASPASSPEAASAADTSSAETPARAAVPARTYVIQSGDNLWKIAKKFYPDSNDINASIKQIREANPEKLANDRNIKIGTEIVIP